MPGARGTTIVRPSAEATPRRYRSPLNPLAALLILNLFGLPALALVLPRARPAVALLLLLTAAGLLAAAVDAGTTARSLTVTHTFVAYVDQDMQPKDFVIETVAAPGWQWAALAAAWALGWALWSWRSGRRDAPAPAAAFVHALTLAWLGTALVLAWQKLAAPGAVALGLLPAVPPIEPALLGGTLAAGVLLAQRSERIGPVFAYLSLFIAAARLPIAMFGTLATQRGWGTYLDVRSIDFIANIATQQPTELAPGSTEQLLWTLWFPQLLLWPGLSMMSAGSVAFAVWLIRRHPL